MIISRLHNMHHPFSFPVHLRFNQFFSGMSSWERRYPEVFNAHIYPPLAAMDSPLSQLIEDENVVTEYHPGRGNGLFATRDIASNSQALFIARPLLCVLDNPRLTSYCDYCFKSPSDNSTWTEGQQIQTLKKCTGCNVLRFCGRVRKNSQVNPVIWLTPLQRCQRSAWSHYHKFECKIYSNQPRALPTLNRAILRLLKQHDAGLLPAGEWEQLHTLEDHYDKVLKVGGQKWQDIMLSSRKLQQDSGGKRSLETILHLVCLVSTQQWDRYFFLTRLGCGKFVHFDKSYFWSHRSCSSPNICTVQSFLRTERIYTLRCLPSNKLWQFPSLWQHLCAHTATNLPRRRTYRFLYRCDCSARITPEGIEWALFLRMLVRVMLAGLASTFSWF